MPERNRTHENLLLGLSEQHHDAKTFIGCYLKSLFVGATRNGQAIAGFVICGLAVNQQHVVVSAISLDVVEGDVPCVENAVPDQGNFLPMRERAHHLDGFWFLSVPRRQPPAENLRERLPPLNPATLAR
jgi:hypothetical protein